MRNVRWIVLVVLAAVMPMPVFAGGVDDLVRTVYNLKAAQQLGRQAAAIRDGRRYNRDGLDQTLGWLRTIQGGERLADRQQRISQRSSRRSTSSRRSLQDGGGLEPYRASRPTRRKGEAPLSEADDIQLLMHMQGD